MKKTMRRKRGGYYGANGAIAPGAMEWKAGVEVAAPAHVRGGKRRASRKTRKSMMKKKRGGASYGAVSASYQGTGARGIADYVPVDTKGAPVDSAAEGAFNNMA
jgi:hypothetical protein